MVTWMVQKLASMPWPSSADSSDSLKYWNQGGSFCELARSNSRMVSESGSGTR